MKITQDDIFSAETRFGTEYLELTSRERWAVVQAMRSLTDSLIHLNLVGGRSERETRSNLRTVSAKGGKIRRHGAVAQVRKRRGRPPGSTNRPQQI